jgi:glycosyltransferase involved in cell wall biosynthesis
MATPKMGVFGTVAALLARVPVRVYHVLGLRWDGLSGPMRRVIRGLDRVACQVATDVMSVSRSLEARLLDEGVAPSSKVRVVGHGSIGVNLRRFKPVDDDERSTLRQEFGIPPSAQVVTFVARLTRDKGIDHLPSIWAGVVSNVPDAWLLVVGDPEPGESVEELSRLTRTSIRSHTSGVERVFQLADLNLSLSRREGLGMVPLEAAACGVPTAAFAVTGIIDTIEDGISGRLVAAGDAAHLIEAVSQVLTTPGELERLGDNARVNVVQRHRAEDVWEGWRAFLEDRREGRDGSPAQLEKREPNG